jgi:hypothetical protein
MPVWEVQFFPAKGERNSPVDKLLELCNVDERNDFLSKLRVLKDSEIKYWQFKWLKQVEGFYQIKQGDFRGYFKSDRKTIVVVHFCRKVSQKAKKEDLGIARSNWKKYVEG